MNKRQRKKQFKKAYGMNPKQYEEWQREHLLEILNETGKRAIENAAEVFRALGEAVKEAAKIVIEELKAWGEEIQVAASFQEIDNMLRKSNILPEGADKELLKHIGIHMDRYGWAYDFYYDEANDEYFVEILQEGGAKDGADVDDPEDIGNGMHDCVGGNGAGDSDCLLGSSSEEFNREEIGG